ncbi:MAG: ABC transporter permease [Gammaproteobacteria bacterium]|nr:ABC transporter permease [Gammaproteobacteria bacterium]
MLATPIDIDDIVAGEMLRCATKGLIAGTAILLVSMLFGAISGYTALVVMPIIFLLGLCFAGLALVMSALSPNYEFFAYYFTLVVTPMSILCGVFYPVTTMPEAVQSIIQLLRLTHAVALIRPILSVETTNALLYLLALGAYAFISFYIAVVLIRRR